MNKIAPAVTTRVSAAKKHMAQAFELHIRECDSKDLPLGLKSGIEANLDNAIDLATSHDELKAYMKSTEFANAMSLAARRGVNGDAIETSGFPIFIPWAEKGKHWIKMPWSHFTRLSGIICLFIIISLLFVKPEDRSRIVVHAYHSTIRWATRDDSRRPRRPRAAATNQVDRGELPQ